MLAWSEGTDNGRQKTRNHGYDVIVGGELFTDSLRSPSQTCHAKPKTQINRRRTLPASFPLVGCYRKQLGLKDFSPKVRTLWHCSRLRSVALYLWLIVVISVRQSTVAAISGLHCRALVMVSSSIRLTAWLQNSKKRAERSGRDWPWAESPRLSPALIICIIICLSWAVNHYRDNAITYKAQRDKNARELKLANAAITDMQMRQRDVAALDAKYTKGVKLMLKLKMMLCVMMLPLVTVVGCTSKQSVSQCVKPPPPRRE